MTEPGENAAPDGPEPIPNLPRVRPPARRPADDEPVLPTVTDDERDLGWGGRPDDRGRDGDGPRDAEWYRHERPPHHG